MRPVRTSECAKCGNSVPADAPHPLCESCVEKSRIENEEAWRSSLKLRAVGNVTQRDLVQVLRPLLKPVTEIVPLEIADPTSLPITSSYFGGSPYFESGDRWPTCEDCSNDMTFIYQIDVRQGSHRKVERFGLLTFFYCWICAHTFKDELAHMFLLPYQSGPNEWMVWNYSDPQESKAVRVDPPHAMKFTTPPRRIDFKMGWSLPASWEVKDHPSPIEEMMKRITPKIVWESYDSAAKELGVVSNYGSHLGGYPVGHNLIPECPDCEKEMDLFMKIGDEGLELPFLDGGAFYFYICFDHPKGLRFRKKLRT